MFEWMYAKKFEKEDVMEIVDKCKDNYYLDITYNPNGTFGVFIGGKRKENKHKRTIDADELLKRIAEKCKTPSLSKDTVNGLCGATAIIYDMLIESGQEKDADKESD